MRLAHRRRDITPGAVELGEEGRSVRREAIQAPAGLDLRREAFDQPATRELAPRAAHMDDPEICFIRELTGALRLWGQGREDPFPVAARHHAAEVGPDVASRLHSRLPVPAAI